MNKDLLTVGDLTKEDIENILKRSSLLKEKQKREETHCSLIGKTLGMFLKRHLRGQGFPSKSVYISWGAGDLSHPQ